MVGCSGVSFVEIVVVYQLVQCISVPCCLLAFFSDVEVKSALVEL